MGESSELWNDAARSMEFQRNFQGAAQCYEKARKFGDESPETLLNLGVSNLQLYEFYNQDKYLASARDYLSAGIEADPRNPKLHHYLALAYLGLREKDLAAEEFFQAAELSTSESWGMVMQFNAELGAPQVYESKKTDVYELFPDPSLYKVFDLVKGFPLDRALFDSLRETYGDRDTDSLAALYLRSVYFKVFEDREFAKSLSLSTDQAKWEALLVFFVRGINPGSKSLVKSCVKGGKLDAQALPAYTRMLVNRYRRDILSSVQEKEGFRALTVLPIRKLEALDSACESAREAAHKGGGKRNAMPIFQTLERAGFALRRGDSCSIPASALQGFQDAGRLRAKLEAQTYDSEFFVLLHSLLKAKRFRYALDLAKKIRVLYEGEGATAHIKEILFRLSLGEEEKFAILSEA